MKKYRVDIEKWNGNVLGSFYIKTEDFPVIEEGDELTLADIEFTDEEDVEEVIRMQFIKEVK